LASAQATDWTIDPAHTAAHFAVRHLGISTVRGDIRKITGTVRHDPANPASDAIDVSIETESVDSGVEMRDNDLRSDHFFDVAKFLGATASCTIDRTDFGMTGYAAMVGNSVTVTIDAELVRPTPAGAR
jgi:polyisoprenoid-binding protein YceI